MPQPKTVTAKTTVIRPFRLIALIFLILAFILLIASLASNYWTHCATYHAGLWTQCSIKEDTRFVLQASGNSERQSNIISVCNSNPRTAWLNAVSAFVILALLVDIGAIVVVILSFFLVAINNLSRIGGFIAVVAGVFLFIACIVYPVMMNKLLPTLIPQAHSFDWWFGWSYGAVWGAMFFLFGAAILLIFCKKEDEVYTNEKTYVVNS